MGFYLQRRQTSFVLLPQRASELASTSLIHIFHNFRGFDYLILLHLLQVIAELVGGLVDALNLAFHDPVLGIEVGELAPQFRVVKVLYLLLDGFGPLAVDLDLFLLDQL